MKCLQVEDHVCLTGGEDGNIRMWDLRKVDEEEDWKRSESSRIPEAIAEEEEENFDDGELVERPSGIRDGADDSAPKELEGPCVRLLEGHSRAVTALYFEDECLVSRAFRISGVSQLTAIF